MNITDKLATALQALLLDYGYAASTENKPAIDARTALAEYEALQGAPQVGDRIRMVGLKVQHDYYTNGREGVLRRQDGAYWWADMDGYEKYTFGCMLVPFGYKIWEVIDRPTTQPEKQA